MNRIVREHYPVEKLPEDLRTGLDENACVRVTVEDESPVEEYEALTLDEIFALSRKSPRRHADEIDADIRRQRDEWDERG